MANAFEMVAELLKGDMNVEELSPSMEWYSTGSTLLDLGISQTIPGGIPSGRAIQIYGGASSCKSVMACTIMGAAMRKGALGFYADVEQTLDKKFAGLYGLDCENENFFRGFSFSKKVAEKIDPDTSPEDIEPETIEEFFDVWLANIIKIFGDKPKVLVVDSLTALPAESEIKKGMNEQGFGGNDRAKKIGLGLRKYQASLASTNTTLFIIDQSRENIGVTFGDSETTSGGKGPEFYASVRVQLKHEGFVKNSKEQVIGIWVKFIVRKNKVGKAHRDGYFRILFDYGMDDIRGNLRYIVDTLTSTKTKGKLTTSKVTMKIPLGENKELSEVTKTIKEWVPYIEENNLEDFLQQQVIDLYNQQYQAEERKPRVWK